MSEPADNLLDQAIVQRVANLRVEARRAVEGLRSGIHRSPHRGASVIFAEHREYRPGDDLRLLDWRAFARSDRHTIKRFEQETHLRAHLLLDVSSSMDFDGGLRATHKREYAATLLAAGSSGIVYPSVRQRRGTCLACFRPALVTNLKKGSTVTLRFPGPNRP